MAAVGGVLLGTYLSQLAHREYAHERAQAYAADANRRVAQACPQGEPQAFIECVVEVVTTTRENQRAEHDLDAQQEMADWARNAVFLSGIAILISGFGLFALLRTIEQGREANRIARQASELDFRPIMAFAGFSSRPGPPNIFYLKPVWINIGKLPAAPTVAITRRVYLDGNPSEADVKVLLDAGGQTSDVFEIIPTGEPVSGPEIAMELNELRILDAFPHGVPQDRGTGVAFRYCAQRTMLVITTIIYRVAVGDVEREWKSEIVLPYVPMLDDQRAPLPPEDWGMSGGIRNRIRMD